MLFRQSYLTLSKLRADWITYRQRKKRAWLQNIKL